MNTSNIAPCGLDCHKCRAYIATRNSDIETLIKCGEEWGKAYNRPIAAEEVMCDGCRTGGRVWLGCRDCGLRQCEKSKEIATCAHCADFPCDQTKQLEKSWDSDHLTKANAELKRG